MANRNQAMAPVESAAPHILPRWERQRRHRLLLDRKVRTVRRTLLAGGVIGTVAFSALAAYETKIANGSDAGVTPPLTAPESQLGAANFFTGQASAALAPASPTATPIPTETATPTATATETATATPDANATTSAKTSAAATKSAKAAAAATKTAKIEATQTAKAAAAATKTAKAEIAATKTAEAEAVATEAAQEQVAAEQTPAAAPAQPNPRTQSS